MPILGNDISGASIGAAASGFLSIGQVDTAHPLLANTEGWHAVNVSQTVPIRAATADQVLARLDNGEPFIVERRVGQGRMLLVAGGLENQWNDLPIRPDYEAPVSAVIDALGWRPDVDAGRLGLWGVSLGGYYAPRAAAFDTRVRACIALTGPFDFAEAFARAPGLTRAAFVARCEALPGPGWSVLPQVR